MRIGGPRLMLGRLPRRAGRAKRYGNAVYQDSLQEPVDLVVFHDPAFKEPWFLLSSPWAPRRSYPPTTWSTSTASGCTSS